MKFLSAVIFLITTSLFSQSYKDAIHEVDSMTRRFSHSLFNRAIVAGIYYAGEDTIVANGRINVFGRKANKNDVFQIGSISKTITGLLFAKALEAGWIKLEAPIGSYLTFLKKNIALNTTRSHLDKLRHIRRVFLIIHLA